MRNDESIKLAQFSRVRPVEGIDHALIQIIPRKKVHCRLATSHQAALLFGDLCVCVYHRVAAGGEMTKEGKIHLLILKCATREHVSHYNYEKYA